MPVIQRTVTIQAPPEKTLDLITDPYRLPQYAPGVSEVKDVHQTPRRVGDTFTVLYAVLSLKMPLRFTIREYAPPTQSTAQVAGQMEGEWRWQLHPQGEATRVDLAIDYRLKLGLLGKALNALLVERMNEKNAEQMLANLKALTERS